MVAIYLGFHVGTATDPSDEHPYRVGPIRSAKKAGSPFVSAPPFQNPSRGGIRIDIRICIADNDGTDLRSLTSPNPTNVVGVLPVVGYGAARNILAYFQKHSETRGCSRIVAFFVRVQVSKEHASDRMRQPHPKETV